MRVPVSDTLSLRGFAGWRFTEHELLLPLDEFRVFNLASPSHSHLTFGVGMVWQL